MGRVQLSGRVELLMDSVLRELSGAGFCSLGPDAQGPLSPQLTTNTVCLFPVKRPTELSTAPGNVSVFSAGVYFLKFIVARTEGKTVGSGPVLVTSTYTVAADYKRLFAYSTPSNFQPEHQMLQEPPWQPTAVHA